MSMCHGTAFAPKCFYSEDTIGIKKGGMRAYAPPPFSFHSVYYSQGNYRNQLWAGATTLRPFRKETFLEVICQPSTQRSSWSA